MASWFVLLVAAMGAYTAASIEDYTHCSLGAYGQRALARTVLLAKSQLALANARASYRVSRSSPGNTYSIYSPKTSERLSPNFKKETKRHKYVFEIKM